MIFCDYGKQISPSFSVVVCSENTGRIISPRCSLRRVAFWIRGESNYGDDFF